MAAGLAMISGPATSVIMAALRPEQAGAGAAVNDTTREVGGTLGVAVLGSVLTSVYVSGVGDRLRALGIPREVTAMAQQSVMAGAQVADGAPSAVAGAVRAAVQDVFVTGLHHASWVAVGVTALAAAIAMLTLRGATLGTPAASDPSEVDGEISLIAP